MVELETDSNWQKIKTLLIELKDKNKIFCPLSPEHYIETSKKDIENARVHDEFLNYLSDGYSFKPELFITSQLISSKIRKNNITLKTYLYENVDNVFRSEMKYTAFKKLNEKSVELFTDGTYTLNQFRSHIPNQNFKQDTKSLMINAMNTSRANKFIQRLEELLKNDNIIICGDLIGKTEVPNWIDMIINQLLKKHKFKKKEIVKLIAEFKANGFSNIPTLNIRTTLLSYISVYSKKEHPNDHIDIMRISTGLPISDILLTDKKRKAEIIESELEKRYKTKVFSGTQSDLSELITELKKI